MIVGDTSRIDKNQKVKVYRNLKHGRRAKPLYSVQQNGKVVARLHSLALVDVKLVVNQAGRNRVILEKRKNVHAFVIGTFVCTPFEGNLATPCGYNPYKNSTFVVGETPVLKASAAVLNENGLTINV